jgi:flagellar protein FlaG
MPLLKKIPDNTELAMSIPALKGEGNTSILLESQNKKTQERSLQERGALLTHFITTLPGGDKKAGKPDEATIARIKKMNLAFNKKLQFVVNQDSNQIIVKVIDPNTDKVIKVLPPEELQRLSDGISEMTGTLFDEKV